MMNFFITGEHPADTDLDNDTLCLPCNFTSGCVVLIHSTSNPRYLGVHTTNFSQGASQTCVNASTCNGSSCAVALYEQSIDGIVDQPEPVIATFAFPGELSRNRTFVHIIISNVHYIHETICSMRQQAVKVI